MKNPIHTCQECHIRRAHGVWRVHKPSGKVDALLMCSQCGLTDYVSRRETFSPGIRTELIRTIGTKFTPPAPNPDYIYPNGMTSSQIAKAISKKWPTKSTVAQSILDSFK